jgi:hypothetical protein
MEPSGGHTLNLTVTDGAAWTGGSIDVHVSGTDNVAGPVIKVFGDGTFVDQVAAGTHTITATATDISGNQTTTPPVTINK